MNNECVWCGRPITWKRRLLRLFWAPWWCDISFVWRQVCSKECYENALNNLAKQAGIDLEKWK